MIVSPYVGELHLLSAHMEADICSHPSPWWGWTLWRCCRGCRVAGLGFCWYKGLWWGWRWNCWGTDPHRSNNHGSKSEEKPENHLHFPSLHQIYKAYQTMTGGQRWYLLFPTSSMYSRLVQCRAKQKTRLKSLSTAFQEYNDSKMKNLAIRKRGRYYLLLQYANKLTEGLRDRDITYAVLTILVVLTH